MLQTLFELFRNEPSLTILNTLRGVFDTIDDDRMSKFVPHLLPKAIEYLATSPTNALLDLVMMLLKQIEWAIGLD